MAGPGPGSEARRQVAAQVRHGGEVGCSVLACTVNRGSARQACVDDRLSDERARVADRPRAVAELTRIIQLQIVAVLLEAAEVDRARIQGNGVAGGVEREQIAEGAHTGDAQIARCSRHSSW